ATVKAGQQFQYTISGSARGNVALPETNDFEFIGGPFTSFSSSTQWINGKMTAKTTASYTYVLRAASEGKYTIPPATITVKRKDYKTNSVEVIVAPAAGGNTSSGNSTRNTHTSSAQSAQNTRSDQPVFLRILPSKRNVYVGEQLVSDLKVYTSVNTQPSGGLKEVPYEGFYKHTLEGDQSSSRENINGKVHVTQVLQRHILIPQKSGKIVIEPFVSEWTVPQRVSGGRSGSIFDDPFFDRVRNVPKKIATNAVTINVKPFPAGAPEGFEGAVGDLKMSANLTADKVSVNDAISLKVTISGIGNISLLGAPKIDFPPDHDVYETTKSTNVSTRGNRISGSVTFEYPMVVRHAGNYRISPITFSWFDPNAETYKTITSSEFAFTVEKGDDMDQQGQIYMPGNRGEQVRNIGTDILDIKRTVPAFTVMNKTLVSSKAYWFAYIIALVLFISAIVLLRTYFRQKADVRLTRNKKANKMARNRLKVAEKARKSGNDAVFFEEAEKAIWGYLSDKLSIEISALSRETVTEVLKSAEIENSLREELIRIIDECEFSRYAPSSQKADMNKLYDETIALIRQLEHNIKTR
ncbi:MAG TPA: BatD family protein, partial [Bacteroidales bacterium]|nr:BatD family protein [Bacteroidales bacterium]